MNKRSKKSILFTGAILLFAISFLINNSVFASDGIVETTFFGNLQDDGNGCGVYTILNLIVDIMTIGIGILAAIGITIVGIKYLTAKGNEEQTRKAKHRMFEIVIGLVAYALMYAGIQWLLPGGKLNTTSCTKLSDAEVATIRAEEKAEKEEREKAAKSGSDSSGSDQSECMKKAAKTVRDKICKYKKPSERIAQTAKLLAGSGDSPSQIYKDTMKVTKTNIDNDCERTGKSCNTFVATVIAASGVDTNIPSRKNSSSNNTRDLYNYLKKSSKWKKISNNPLDSREGDIVVKPRPSGHITITVKKNGKLVTAHASLCYSFPIVSNSIWTDYSGTPTVFRYVGK